MKMKDLSKIDAASVTKNKNLLANLGIIVLALIITRNMHFSQLNKINLLKSQIAEEERITGFVDELKTLENKIDSLEKEFPVGLTSDVVIDTVSSLARKNDVKIVSIDSKSIIDKKLYFQLPVSLSMVTNYHKLGHLVSDIENMGMFKVKSLSISRKDTSLAEEAIEDVATLELLAISLKKK